MSNQITTEEAHEFASAMAGMHPPTNTNLIEAHMEWWQENAPSHAGPIENWYAGWMAKIEDDEMTSMLAYGNFTDKLDEMGIEY